MDIQASSGDDEADPLIRTKAYALGPSAPTIDDVDILIRHPGYSDACNTLLYFRPLDNHGVHHATVQVACAVLVNNQWDCFLSIDKEGHHPVDTGLEEILTSQSYYLQVPGGSGVLSKYPITPTFEHWRFPHESLPSNWHDVRSIQLSSLVPSDICQFTQRAYAVENAHIVPSSQREWFKNNGMARYARTSAVDRMKCTDNTIQLQSHIHTVFDEKRFAIVPIKGYFVVYCMNPTPENHFELDLHRIRLGQNITKTKSKFLFARFAYTVFENLRNFLEEGDSRELRLSKGHEFEVKDFHRLDCRDFARQTALQGKSKSRSPTKRARTDDTNDALNRGWWTDESCSSDTDVEEKPRGRKRHRSKSPEQGSSHTSISVPSQEISKRQTIEQGILLVE